MDASDKFKNLNIEPLEADLLNEFAVKIEGDADITRYCLIVIPFRGNMRGGRFSMTNGVLVIDTLEKTSYIFNPDSYLSPDYVGEKLIREYPTLGITDAENTTYLIQEAIKQIKVNMATFHDIVIGDLNGY